MQQLIVNQFSGLNDTIRDRFAKESDIGQIVEGQNFVINNKLPEVTRTPFLNGIKLPDADHRVGADGQKLVPSIQNRYIVNGFKRVKLNGVVHYIYVIDGNVYRLLPVPNNQNNLEKIYDKLDSVALCTFAVYANKLIIMNGVDTALEFDGENCTQQEIKDPNGIVGDNNHWMLAVIANNRIYYFTRDNYIFTPQPTTTSNFENNPSEAGGIDGTVDGIMINWSKGGNTIAATAFSAKTIIIFSDEGEIQRLDGSMPFGGNDSDYHKLSMLSDELGGVSALGVATNNIDVYFQSNKGLNSLNAVQSFADMRVSDIFYPIKDRVSPFVYEAFQSNMQYYSTIYLKDKIYVLYRTSTQTYLYEYDILTKDIAQSVYDVRITYQSVVNGIIQLGDDEGNIYIIQPLYYNNNLSYIELNWLPTKYGVGRLKWWAEAIFVFETSKDSEIQIEHMHVKNDMKDLFEQGYRFKESNADSWDNGKWDNSSWDERGFRIFRMKDIGRSGAIKFRIKTRKPTDWFRLKELQLFYKPQGLVRA